LLYFRDKKVVGVFAFSCAASIVEVSEQGSPLYDQTPGTRGGVFAGMTAADRWLQL
jgi:hypothetical protein